MKEAAKYKIREGVTMRFLHTGETTNNKFCLIEAEYVFGKGFPEHIHSKEDEVFYIINGNIDFVLNNKIVNIKSGQSIYLPRNIKHGFQIKSKTAKVLILIEPAGLEKYFQMLGMFLINNPNSEIADEDNEKLLNGFEIQFSK